MGSQTVAHAVVLFDGVCNLCSTSVQFIIQRDPQEHFQFASLQSEKAKTLLKQVGHSGDETLASIVLIEDGKYFEESTAALKIASALTFPWGLLKAFLIFPKFLRDPFYRLVARNRYNWFGKRDTCFLPSPEYKKRFIE